MLSPSSLVMKTVAAGMCREGGGRGVVDCVPLCVEEVETSSTALEHTSMLQAHG